jgi:hypothetical protein
VPFKIPIGQLNSSAWKKAKQSSLACQEVGSVALKVDPQVHTTILFGSYSFFARGEQNPFFPPLSYSILNHLTKLIFLEPKVCLNNI